MSTIETAPEKAGCAPSGVDEKDFDWEFHLLTCSQKVNYN